MRNQTNVTLAFEDNRQSEAHKVMEHASSTIKYVKWQMRAHVMSFKLLDINYDIDL